MQGIAALPTGMAPEGAPPEQTGLGSLSAEEASTLGRLLSKVSQEEIDQLREISADLKQFSLPELKDFLGGVDYLMQNADKYKQSVRNLITRGIVEPGDLPADYVPTFYSILRQMIVDAIQQGDGAPVAEFAKGGLVGLAEKVRRAGTGGDTILAHINPQEARALKAMGGSGTINPKTGLPEYKSFWSKVGTFLKKAAPIILPIALSFIPGLGTAVGAMIGGALGVGAGTATALSGALIGAVGSGVGGLIAGQKPGQALLSAALGGVGGYMFSGGLSGVSGLFSGGATGAEAAANAAGAAGAAGAAEGAAAGAVSPTVTAAGAGPVNAINPATQAAATYGNFGGPDALKGVADSLGSGTSGFNMSGQSGGLGGLFSKVGNFVQEHPYMTAALAGGAGLMLGSSQAQGQEAPNLVQGPTGQELLAQNPTKYGFDVNNFRPQQTSVRVVPTISPAFPDGYYGQMPGYYGMTRAKAGGHISGPGTGTSDSIPALLSDGEFVLTAKAVRGAGNGDRIKGAKKLYKLMNELERRS